MKFLLQDQKFSRLKKKRCMDVMSRTCETATQPLRNCKVAFRRVSVNFRDTAPLRISRKRVKHPVICFPARRHCHRNPHLRRLIPRPWYHYLSAPLMRTKPIVNNAKCHIVQTLFPLIFVIFFLFLFFNYDSCVLSK